MPVPEPPVVMVAVVTAVVVPVPSVASVLSVASVPSVASVAFVPSVSSVSSVVVVVRHVRTGRRRRRRDRAGAHRAAEDHGGCHAERSRETGYTHRDLLSPQATSACLDWAPPASALKVRAESCRARKALNVMHQEIL
jgi:hypothetical protein